MLLHVLLHQLESVLRPDSLDTRAVVAAAEDAQVHEPGRGGGRAWVSVRVARVRELESLEGSWWCESDGRATAEAT